MVIGAIEIDGAHQQPAGCRAAEPFPWKRMRAGESRVLRGSGCSLPSGPPKGPTPRAGERASTGWPLEASDFLRVTA